MTELLRTTQHGNVLRLVLNDQRTRNSLSDEMLGELTEALQAAETDHSVSAIIISADGPVFCSGHNLKQLTARRTDSDGGQAYFEEIFSRCAKMMMLIMQHRCAIIAEVDGLASAAGCQLVASCDLAYASSTARFCTPGVNIGLFCSTPMTAISRTMSSKHALEMLLTGDIFDADFAARTGLVNSVHIPEGLSKHVNEIAAKIASKSATAIAYGKKLFHTQQKLPVVEAYDVCAEVMVANMLDAEAREGIAAFIEKRHPNWRSKVPS